MAGYVTGISNCKSNSYFSRLCTYLGRQRSCRQRLQGRHTAEDTHQHFPVHLVPVLSEAMVNQSLSFALFHCRAVSQRQAAGKRRAECCAARTERDKARRQSQWAGRGSQLGAALRCRCVHAARCKPLATQRCAACLHVFDERLVLLLEPLVPGLPVTRPRADLQAAQR